MFNKANISFSKYFYFIIIIVVVFTKIALYNLYLYKKEVEDSYYKNNIISQKIAYDSSIDKFSLLAKYIFDKEINKKEVLELFQKSITSENEKDKIYYKALFYRTLNPSFEYMKKDGIRQLQFETPDNKSFLRFHNPSTFNDDLTSVRPSMKYVNENKVPISIFETGKILSGFRNIFPMFYNNEYLGAVEISLTLKSMVDSLQKLDNRKENFRFVTPQQNKYNQKRRKDNTTGYKGVSVQTNCPKYIVRIVYGGKRHHLGTFTDPAEAAKVYDRKAIEVFGDYACTNFPREEYIKESNNGQTE